MNLKFEGELEHLVREIEAKRQHIDDQTVLVDVLEQDGHDVCEQRKALAKERAELAVRIAQQFQLLQKVTTMDSTLG